MAKNELGKKSIKGLSIGRQLSLVSLIVTLLIIILGFFVIYSIYRIKNINSNYAIILSMDDCIEKMTDSQSTFLLKESTQKDFYIDENVKSVIDFKGYASKLNTLIAEFSETSNNYKQIRKYNIDSLEDLAFKYDYLFDSLVTLTQIKGFKDYGIIGKMHSVAHELENTVSNLNNQELYIQLLQLRRNEKDYFLRNDPAYFQRFKSNTQNFTAILDTSTIDLFVKEQLSKKAIEYQDLFESIMKYDKKIGLTNSYGILTSLEDTKYQIIDLNNSFIQVFSNLQERETKSVVIRFIIVLAIITLSLALIIRKIRKNISLPFNEIKGSLQSLSLGIIPESLHEKNSSEEIREITRVLNQIIFGFRNMIDFAKNLKDGKFNESFEPLSDKDDLGNALIDMRSGLYKAEQEREQQHKEEEKQAWINKGTADFAEVLNQNYTNTEEFSYAVISKLIKYLGANQGGFFVHEKNNEESYLKLASAIAYDRRKYVNDRIEIGEGFVGSCVLENNVFYRTEIPEDYIKITSGMGGSNPRVLLIVPLVLESEIYGAIEIACFNPIEDYKIEFVKSISESITNNMSSVKSKEETQKLLDQTQAQAEQIIQAEEEMRQNLEEMQATQEESARREEKLGEELKEANKTIDKLENQLKEQIKNIKE